MRPTIFPLALAILGFSACGTVNSGWLVNGGGYMNLSIDGEAYRLEIDADDGNVKLRPNKHYVTFLGKDDAGTRLQVMIYKPVLGKNSPQTNSNYTFLVREGSSPARIIDAESSYVAFDEKSDSLWSADLHLVFNRCEVEECDTSRVLVTGRMRYWVDPDDY
jgi:hypothetical protein